MTYAKPSSLAARLRVLEQSSASPSAFAVASAPRPDRAAAWGPMRWRRREGGALLPSRAEAVLSAGSNPSIMPDSVSNCVSKPGKESSTGCEPRLTSIRHRQQSSEPSVPAHRTQSSAVGHPSVGCHLLKDAL